MWDLMLSNFAYAEETGFKNLYVWMDGCDLFLKNRYSASMKVVSSFYKREYKP
jgi:hypothetical protein